MKVESATRNSRVSSVWIKKQIDVVQRRQVPEGLISADQAPFMASNVPKVERVLIRNEQRVRTQNTNHEVRMSDDGIHANLYYPDGTLYKVGLKLNLPEGKTLDQTLRALTYSDEQEERFELNSMKVFYKKETDEVIFRESGLNGGGWWHIVEFLFHLLKPGTLHAPEPRRSMPPEEQRPDQSSNNSGNKGEKK